MRYPESKPHPTIRTTCRDHKNEREKVVYSLPYFNPGKTFRDFDHTLQNAIEALNRRVFYVSFDEDGNGVSPPQPINKFHVNTNLNRFRQKFLYNSPKFEKLSMQQVVDTFSGSKRKMYESTMRRLQDNPTLEPLKGKVEFFVKREKTKPDGVPRVITVPSMERRLQMGQFIKAIEHHSYRRIDSIFDQPVRGHKTVMKGYSSPQVACHMLKKWQSFKRPCWLGYDAKRFDQHISRLALQYELSTYRGLFGRDKDLERFFKDQLDPRFCFYSKYGNIFAKTSGSRGSGQPNTGLGNIILMCAMMWTYMKKQPFRSELVNAGDDCGIICEEEHAQAFIDGISSEFLDMGFTMTFEGKTTVFEEIVFCQMSPIETPTGWVMCRDIKTALAKDTTCTLPINSVHEYKEWMRSVADSGLAFSGGMPVFDSFYKAMKRCAGSGKVMDKARFTNEYSFLGQVRKDTNRTGLPVDELTRASFQRGYGIDSDTQKAIEHYYDKLEVEEPKSFNYSTDEVYPTLDPFIRLF